MLPDFFNLPHIFVVFSPGTGGNFLSGLCHRIINNDFRNLEIQSVGSSHNIIPDCLNFGTISQETVFFGSKENQEKYYLEKIIAKYSNVTCPMVTWTHDFSNIQLYRKYFKNAKIISITCNNDEEKLSGLLLNITKMLFRNSQEWPLGQGLAKFLSSNLEFGSKLELKSILKSQYIDQIDLMYDQRFNDHYKNIVNFSIIRANLRYFGFLNRVDRVFYKELPVLDYVFYQNKNEKSNIMYCIENTLTHYHQLCDHNLSFSYLTDGNSLLLESLLEFINEKTLDFNQKNFINQSFEKYLSVQNHTILHDPKAFYANFKASVQDFIKVN